MTTAKKILLDEINKAKKDQLRIADVGGVNRPIVYIAGKISGLDEGEAWSVFKAKQLELETIGFEVINPVELIQHLNIKREAEGLKALTDKENRDEIMRICEKSLDKADEVHLLDNWKQSEGTHHEINFAKRTGIKVVYPDEVYNVKVFRIDQKWNVLKEEGQRIGRSAANRLAKRMINKYSKWSGKFFVEIKLLN